MKPFFSVNILHLEKIRCNCDGCEKSLVAGESRREMIFLIPCKIFDHRQT